METGNERLLRVLGDVGGDLIANAERKTFAPSPWRRILPVAACLILVVGLTAVAVPRFLVPKSAEKHEDYAASAGNLPTADGVTEEYKQNLEEPKAEPQQEPETDLPGTVKEESKSDQALAPKEELVFWDTVYYVEAQYTKEEALPLLGAGLGTVEKADNPDLTGANVYTRQDAETREDYKERPVPLEIFVENEQGYLYCLTYYLSDEPLMEWLQAQYLWQEGRLDMLADTFVRDLEYSLYACGMDLQYNFNNGEIELPPEQLLHLFKVTLQMERQAGSRTEDLDSYLWEEGEGYLIPVEDIRKQLHKYLDAFTWKPEELPGYDSELEAVWMESLSIDGYDGYDGELYLKIKESGCALDVENQKLVLTVQRCIGEEVLEERQYVIHFQTGESFETEYARYEFIYTVYPS